MILLAGGCSGERHSGVVLQVADIASIKVFVENRPDKGPKLGPFSAAPEDYERILGLLQDGSADQRPAKWQGMGSLVIRTQAGEKVEVALFWTGAEVGAYKVGQTCYRGGSDTEFIKVLADCASHAAKGK